MQELYTILHIFGGDALVNHYIAFMIAEEIQAFRDFQLDRSGANYAEGILNVTNADGKNVSIGYANPNRPQRGKGYDDPYLHSEPQLLENVKKTALPNANNTWAESTSDTLHIVIFTQLTPCPSCRNTLRQARQQIADALPNGMKLDFTVWTSRVQNRYTRYPGNVFTPYDVVQFNLGN